MSAPYLPMIAQVGLAFNIYGYDSTNPNELTLSVSLDSGWTWTPLSITNGFPFPFTRLDSSGWLFLRSSVVNLLPTGAPWWEPEYYLDNDSVIFRFTQTVSNKVFYIDDIQMSAIEILAIKLINFEARTTNTNTLVNWRANSESEYELFVLEKSKDAVHFQSVTQQYAKGKGEFDYQYTDELNRDKTFYRLKMISDDGSVAYSKIVMTKTTNENTELLQALYPVPSQDVVHLLLHNTKEQNVSISVMDIRGAKLLEKNIYLKEGVNNYSLDLKGSSSGTYFLTVIAGDKIENRQLIIRK